MISLSFAWSLSNKVARYIKKFILCARGTSDVWKVPRRHVIYRLKNIKKNLNNKWFMYDDCSRQKLNFKNNIPLIHRNVRSWFFFCEVIRRKKKLARALESRAAYIICAHCLLLENPNYILAKRVVLLLCVARRALIIWKFILFRSFYTHNYCTNIHNR